MAGMLNIGITGLNAAQAALNTTSHNISNATTPGFSRQHTVQGTAVPVFAGVGFFGQGTQIETVKRSYDQFLENQVLSADTKRASLDAFDSQIAQIDNLLADPNAGLSPALQGFFNGVQELAANPASVPARQSMISSAQAMVARFHQLDTRLAEMRDGLEQNLVGTVDQINSYATEIAKLNQSIINVQVAGPSVPANDLLDQRDNLVRELNQMVRVSTIEEDNGALSVFIGNGQPLVVGLQATTLSATPSNEDPGRLAIGLQMPNGSSVQIPETLLSGGALGGLLEFRRDALDVVQDKLGLVAVGLAETFNAQHRLGQDLDGNLGLDFFKPLNPEVRPVAGATGTPDVAFDDVSNLTGGTYRLTYTDATGGYTLVDRATGNSVSAGDVGLAITPPGTTVAGEVFVIEPTRAAAQNVAVGIGDTRLLAAAGPVRTVENTGNLGTGSIDSVRANSVAGFGTGSPHIGAHTLAFDGANNRYEVRDSGNALIGTVAYDPAVDSAGVTRTLPGALGGIEITLSGTPSDGDRFALESNGAGVADNSNAVALGALQTTKTLFGSGGTATASYQSAYSNLVSEVGNKTSEVKVGKAAQESLLEQATAAREALSGVNLDEEAANLIRFQQAYQASARVMSISGTLFDEILGITR